MNWFVRQCSELWAEFFVDPESVWATFYYLRPEWTIENSVCAPGVHEDCSRKVTNFDGHVEGF